MSSPAAPEGAETRTALRELALLPARRRLRPQILVADLDRLRRFHGSGSTFRRALNGVWLPDSLAAIDAGNLWPRTFGFGVSAISSFAGAGFHPAEVAVVTGHFSPNAIQAALTRRGYHRSRMLVLRGGDGSIDSRTAAGRLALSALDRVRVTRRRLIAASTTSLAEDAVAPTRSMAMNSDVRLAATALGEITAAVIKPSLSIQAPTGVLVTPITRNRPLFVSAGIDDRGLAGRTVKIVLVYATNRQAKADAAELAAKFPKTPLLNSPSMRFDEILNELHIGVRDGRAVVITGMIPAGGRSGLWRSLVENGELALLIPLFVP